jgi:hypothetical protein
MICNAIIGYSGFVGQNLVNFLTSEVKRFNSSNIEKIKNESFDVLYITAIQAKKWWANQNPVEDKGLIDELFSHLSTVKANKQRGQVFLFAFLFI